MQILDSLLYIPSFDHRFDPKPILFSHEGLMCAVSIIKGKIKFSISAWEGTDKILWFLHATQSNSQMRNKKKTLQVYTFTYLQF